MSKPLSILFFVASLTATSSFAAPTLVAPECALRFAASTPSEETDALTAYFEDLQKRQVLTDAHLRHLKTELEAGKLVNPITEEEAKANAGLQVHQKAIQEYLDQATLDLKKLLAWSQEFLEEKTRVRVRREKTRKATHDLYERITFYPVPTGSFEMGKQGKTVPVTLTHPFEMMPTPVTQRMWAELMGENPSKFADGDESKVITINGKQIKMQPDNPVEQVTWWSVVEYANRMSIKAGLKPVYNLRGVKFKQGTRAEDGSLDAESGQENNVKINSPQGDVYQAEGFRLPTEAENEYILRAAGRVNGNYYFSDYKADLKDHAWYKKNADSKTHPVAQLTPLIIDVPNGKFDFYDLIGNVWEWNNDWYADNLSGGNNPPGAKSGSYRIMRGGSWSNNEHDIHSARRSAWEPGFRASNVGFRLVRTLR